MSLPVVYFDHIEMSITNMGCCIRTM